MVPKQNINFQSQPDFGVKLFIVSASAIRLIAVDQDIEALAAGKSIIDVPGVQKRLLFASIATSVIAQNEQEAIRLALQKSREVFPPDEEWTAHVVNINCAGNFIPYAPSFG